MPESDAPSESHRRHTAAAREYAARHFTDPELRAADAAAFDGISERAQRQALTACGESWQHILRTLRMAEGAALLESTTLPIETVARLSGYRSAPAFAKVFSAWYSATPREFRRGKGGPARAGGATGAFYRPAARAAAERAGRPAPDHRNRTRQADFEAILDVEIREAEARLQDRFMIGKAKPFGYSIAELSKERDEPRRPRDEPEWWREHRARFDEWVDAHSPSAERAHDDFG